VGAEHAKNNGRGRNPPPAGYRWKPGQSGNPAGRPKGSGLTDRLRALLDADDGATAERIVRAVVAAAEAGDAAFVKLIWDRLDGPVAARVELDSQPGSRVVVLPDDQFERFAAGERAVLLGWGVPAGWESRVKVCARSDMELLG
jgi:hypothetical protein